MQIFFRYYLFIIGWFVVVQLSAQQIYTTEIGIHGGGSLAIVDVDAINITGVRPNVGATFRYLFNQRIGIMADIHRTSVKGNFEHRYGVLYPGFIPVSHFVHALDVSFAFNFLDYGKVDNILKSSNYSTYLFAGIGIVDVAGKLNVNDIAPTIPFGIGMKVKLDTRIHLNLQLTHRLIVGNDRIENNVTMGNPVQLNGSNIFKNDQLTTATIGLTLNMFRRNCRCMNYQ